MAASKSVENRVPVKFHPSKEKEKVDQLDINAIGDEFIRGSEHRLRQFRKFT